MQAEILSTGDEILSGALVDTNTSHISQILEDNGIEVVRHHTVGDDMAVLISSLQEIGNRADVAVVTGGLGPTQDDLSSEAAARAAGVPLIFDKRALADIEWFFEKHGRPMAESNRKQAYFPQGAQCLPNPVGTAPGFAMTIGRCRFYFMPGVPFEMYRMLDDQVLPQILSQQGGVTRFHLRAVISSFGLPESVVGEKVAGLTQRFPDIKLGLRAKFPEIQVKLYVNATDENAGRRMLSEASEWIVHQLGDHVFSIKGHSMADETGALLAARGATIAVAESCTGGLLAHWLTNTPGASQYFSLSAVTYANSAKVKVLGVSSDTLDRVGAVDEKTATEMAAGVRQVAGATYGLSTTGIAGPDGGTPDKPVGTVCIGLAGPGFSTAKKFCLGTNNRWMNKQIFAMNALDLLRRHLKDTANP